MTDHESRWAMRCILTTLTCEFRPDTVIDVVDGAEAMGHASARRPLMHLRAGGAGATELTGCLCDCRDAVLIVHFALPPTGTRWALPHALVARPAITAPDPRNRSRRTRYVAIGHPARVALIRLQQIALVTVIPADGHQSPLDGVTR